MAVGLILAGLQAFPGEIGRIGFLDHLAATVVMFAVAWPLLVMKLHGRSLMMAGDAKLLMAIGALMGTTFLLWAFAWGSIIGGVAAVAFVLLSMARGRTLAQGLQSYLPYGVYLSAGALVTLFSGIPR
jgi:prepilin signal peptidase PulO-like enzyme (type II secretory pathway)